MKFLYTEHEGGEWLVYENNGIENEEQLRRMVANEDNWTMVDDAPLHMSYFRIRVGATDMHAILLEDGSVYDGGFRSWSKQYTNQYYEQQMARLCKE